PQALADSRPRPAEVVEELRPARGREAVGEVVVDDRSEALPDRILAVQAGIVLLPPVVVEGDRQRVDRLDGRDQVRDATLAGQGGGGGLGGEMRVEARVFGWVAVRVIFPIPETPPMSGT